MDSSIPIPGGKPTLHITPSASTAQVPAHGVLPETAPDPSPHAPSTITAVVTSDAPGGQPLIANPIESRDLVPGLPGVWRVVAQLGFPTVFAGVMVWWVVYETPRREKVAIELQQSTQELFRQENRMQRDHDDARMGRLYESFELLRNAVDSNTNELIRRRMDEEIGKD